MTARKFYFNNSSLYDLACSQRYVYHVVKGAITPLSDPFLAKGHFYHKLAKLIDREANTAMMMSLFNKPAGWEEHGQDYLNKAAVLVEKVYLENQELYREHLREQWIEVELDPIDILNIETDQVETVIPIACGTLDVISFLPSDNFVLISDYKTVNKPLTGDHASTYNLKSQQFFYPWLLSLKHDFLPETWQAAIKAGRYGFSYIHCAPLTNKYLRMPHRPIDQNILAQYVQQFTEKAALAAYLHVNPQSAVKDGSIHDRCFRCPFTGICELHSPEQEAKHFQLWPYKHKPYNPKERDE